MASPQLNANRAAPQCDRNPSACRPVGSSANTYACITVLIGSDTTDHHRQTQVAEQNYIFRPNPHQTAEQLRTPSRRFCLVARRLRTSPGRMPPLVAITNPSRSLRSWSRSAWPSSCSDAPNPYAWAVSKKLIPTSRACRIASMAASASNEPQSPPICQVPKAIRETCRPLRPSSTVLHRPEPSFLSSRARVAQRPARAMLSTSSASSSCASVSLPDSTCPRSMTTWRIVLRSLSACLATAAASS